MTGLKEENGKAFRHFFLPKDGAVLASVAGGEGVYLWDHEGRRYLDVTSGPVVSNLGTWQCACFGGYGRASAGCDLCLASHLRERCQPGPGERRYPGGRARVRSRLFRLRRLGGHRKRDQTRSPAGPLPEARSCVRR